MAEFKKLSAVEAVASVSDTASVLIEEGGVIKRAPKDEVGGVKITSTAEVGQSIVVKAVDGAGNPTEWECAKVVSQSDWNQNDSEGDGYIKNKPFYEEYVDTTFANEQTFVVDENGQAIIEMTDGNSWPMAGESFTVVFDGISYTGTVWEDSDVCTRTDFTTNDGVDVMIRDIRNILTSAELAGEHTISITVQSQIVHKMDEKFLPEQKVLEVNGQTGYVRLTASDVGAASSSALAGKLGKSNPECSGAFSMNRKPGSSVGSYSCTLGYYAIASGSFSMAEGSATDATGECAHAEGCNTEASGNSSHAEGLLTIASGDFQNVRGKCNVANADYAEIVGNGSYTIYHGGYEARSRSNAYTLSWGGTPWYKSRPQFGGNAQDDGAQTVMANGDKELILTSSTEGSTKKFRITVDDSGTLSAAEVTE